MRGKVLLLRRGTLLLILTALVAAGIFMAVGGPSFVSASAAKRQLPIYSVEREEKVCAISFDAASGNGGFNAAATKTWLQLLDSKNVGYINWSACGKSETASAFKPGTNLKAIKRGTSQLTESGKLIRSYYRTRAGK